VYSFRTKRIHFIISRQILLAQSCTKQVYTSLKQNQLPTSRRILGRSFKKSPREKVKKSTTATLFVIQMHVYGDCTKEMDRMKGDTPYSKQVPYTLWPDFNQRMRNCYLQRFCLPYKYFARKGMIYLFRDIEWTELACVRFEANFKNPWRKLTLLLPIVLFFSCGKVRIRILKSASSQLIFLWPRHCAWFGRKTLFSQLGFDVSKKPPRTLNLPLLILIDQNWAINLLIWKI